MADARLLVEVAGDAAKFHQTMDRVVREGENVRAQAERMAKTSAVAIAAIGVTSAAAVTTMAVQASNDMRELVREAELLGTTAGSLSEWEYAGRSMGLEVGKVRDIMKDLNDKVGDFARTGGGEAADVFEQLGLKAEQFIGLAPDQALLRIGDALDGLTQSEKTFFLESIADDASRLIPLLDDNAARFHTLAEEGRNFGTVVTSAQADVASGFADVLKDAQNMASGFKTQLGVGLAPTFEGVLNYLEEVTDGFGGPKEAAQATAVAIVQAMQDSVQGLRVFTSQLDDVRKAYFQIRKFQSDVAAFGATVNNIATGDDTLPPAFMESQQWQRRIDAIDNGEGVSADVDRQLGSLLEHMKQANSQAMPQLNQTAIAAATNIGILSGATARSQAQVEALANNTSDTNSRMADYLKQTEDTRVAVQDFGNTAISTTRALRAAQGGGWGRGAMGAMEGEQDNGGRSVRQRIEAGKDLSSYWLEPNPTARPTWSTDYLSSPSAMGAAINGMGAGLSPTPKSRGSVHVTVTKDGSSVSGEVEGDDEFISRLADALSSTASSV